MKKTKLILSFALIFILSGAIVLASHIVKTSSGGDSFSVNQSISNLFNVSVNNTDATEDLNITSVIITLPSSFTFIADSNGTSAGTHTFSNISNTLNWTNDGLVMNNTLKYFWFNAIAAIPGAYNITVTTVNSTGDYMSNLSVQVNDTTNPIAAQGTAPVNYYNDSDGNITFDFRCSDNIHVSWIQLWTNTTGNWAVNYSNSSYTNNTWLNITVSGIPGGSNHKWAVWCNDTSGLTNMTENRTFNLDTPPIAAQGTNPIDNYNDTDGSITFDLRCSDNVNVSWIQLWTNINGTWKANYTNSSYINNTWLNITASNIPAGVNYKWAVWCNDTVGLTNITENRTFSVDTPPIAAQGTAPVNYYNDSDGNITFDFKCSDNVNVSWIQLWTNTTGIWHANYTNHSYINNTWINITINGIEEGKNYKWQVYCNDTSDSENTTTNRTFTVDKTNPDIIRTYPGNNAEYTLSSGGTKTVTFTYRLTDNFGIKNCSLYIGGSMEDSDLSIPNDTNQTLSYAFDNDGTYSWKIGCFDYSGNPDNSTSRDIIINPYSSNNNNGGGNDNTDTTNNQSAGTITSNKTVTNLLKGSRVTFTFNGTSHSITVKNISSYSAYLILASTPITFSIDVGETKTFDLNGNGKIDFSINLTDVSATKVNLSLMVIPEVNVTGSMTNQTGNQTNVTGNFTSQKLEIQIAPEGWKWIALALTVIVVAFAVATIVLIQRRKNKSWWKKKGK